MQLLIPSTTGLLLLLAGSAGVARGFDIRDLYKGAVKGDVSKR